MQKKIIVGNLGADAEVRRENGREFVSMSIANTERRKREDGTIVETTNWVSATLNGNGGNLLQYLKKGARVYAYGDYSVRMFHSEKQRALVAGVNLFIRDIELIATNTDPIPRDLYDEEGIAHTIQKYYWCVDAKKCQLYDRRGLPYLVDDAGFVWAPNTPSSVGNITTSEDIQSEDTGNTDTNLPLTNEASSDIAKQPADQEAESNKTRRSRKNNS